MQYQCYKFFLEFFFQIGKFQIAVDYTEKSLAQRFPKFRNYHSSQLPVFWSYVVVHSAARLLRRFSLCMNVTYGAIF